MQQLHLQLYARPKSAGFTEELSAFRTATLGPEPVTVELRVDAPIKEKLVEVRLDPDDKPSTFALHELSIAATDGAELYRWDHEPNSLTAMTDMVASRDGGVVIVKSLSSEPFMLLSLARPEPKGVIVTLSMSEAVQSHGDSAALAEAVRSLHSSLRFSLDDLATEQEALQDALVVQQAHSRNETSMIEGRLEALQEAQVVQQEHSRNEAAVIEGRLVDTLNAARHEREIALAEVRDDWRSVRRQIADMSDTVDRRGRDRQSEMAATLRAEIAALTQAVHRLSAVQETMARIRHELDVPSDPEIVPALRSLRFEAERARGQLRSQESSLSWQMTAPLRAIGDLFKAPRKP